MRFSVNSIKDTTLRKSSIQGQTFNFWTWVLHDQNLIPTKSDLLAGKDAAFGEGPET